MLLPSFEYHQPKNLKEVFEILDHHGAQARLLAGGTDLLVKMKKKLMSPDHIVSLEGIGDLLEIYISDGRISLGSMVTAAALAQNRTVAMHLPGLGRGAACLGSPQVRNRATIGGNLCTARPAADLPPPLMVMDASVVLESTGGRRVVPLEQFFRGPGETMSNAEEVMTSITVDQPEPGTGGGYIKLGLRRALEISIVNVAAVIILDGDGKTVKAARIALGAVAPIPMRAVRAEKALLGARAGDEAFTRAGLLAAEEASPITDHRGSAEYRRGMVAVLTRRSLNQAWKSALRE
jgi:CO/xanthine dehydrogenase FAD-binding subunit